MSVEPSELMSEVWTRWQGHVIDGVFPLGRILGCSDHSGVFLTRSAAPAPSEVAIKLLPTDRALAESQLPRWKSAGRLAHPHLLGLLHSGGCQLEGLPYLYVVMEYADQTLAQLLRHRALTDDEVREMLPPMLDALAFLHNQDLVQGQLKPANILVVGDRLKLASDTIRRVGESTVNLGVPTAYDAPEVRHGSNSTAGDIWALGVTLLEALTGRPPSSLGEPVMLPAGFSPAFRDIVARCLSPSPKDRPSVTELSAWVGDPAPVSVPSTPIEPAAAAPREPTSPGSAPPRTALPPTATAPETARPRMAQSSKSRALPAAGLGAVAILAVSWAGIRLLGSHSTPDPPPPQSGTLVESQSVAPVADVGTPAEVPTTPGRNDGAASTPTLHEEIPEVSQSAHRTIRGHIKVWVRVIVDQNGSVFAATLDRSASSRYFQRVALAAAKKWTFPPINTPSRRLMQVRFDFSRDGTTGRAVTLD